MKKITVISRNSNRFGVIAALSVLGSLLAMGSVLGQSCPVYPIALSSQSLVDVAPGTVLEDIWNGAGPGNFGWLSWTGNPGEPSLVGSLTQPGDSSTYVNPNNPNDHILIAGDWVWGKPGVSNSKGVRNALDQLIGIPITVPIWDQAQGSGGNGAYHISGFAIIEIVSYRLPSQNRISALFLGYTSCGWITSIKPTPSPAAKS